MSEFQDLRERIRNALGAEDPEVRALAAMVAADAATLTTRAMAGEDVESELQHVHAAALALSAGVQQQIAREFQAWLQTIVSSVVSGALSAI